MANLPQKILIVDNDEGMLNRLEQGLAPHKIAVVKAKNWENALYQFNNNKVEVAIVALELEGMPGTALIQKWRQHELTIKREVTFIICSGQKRSAEDEALITELENIQIVTKPLTPPVLLGIMANAMKNNEARVKLLQLQTKVIEPLLHAEKYDKALEIAKKNLDGFGPPGRFQSAVIHDLAKQSEDALRMLDGLSQEDAKNLKYINEMGRINLKLGRLEAARSAFEKADKAAPFNIERMQEMARMYLKMNLPEETVKKYEQILKVNPEKPDLKYDMYDELLKAGFDAHAVSFCKKTSTPKELVRHFNNKGVLFSKSKQYVDAIDEYKKAMRLIPGSKEVYRILYNMAISHINLKSFDHIKEAHALLEECLKLAPDYDKAKEKIAITTKYIGTKKAG